MKPPSSAQTFRQVAAMPPAVRLALANRKPSPVPAKTPTAMTEAYRQQFQTTADEKAWQPDAAQAEAVIQLQQLLEALEKPTATPPMGLWLYGPPGRGKSRLLDLFMQQVSAPNKRRVHFHAFIEEIHRRLHALPVLPSSKPGKSRNPDPLERLANELAAEACVLGFDEFYLTNIADAMLLGRLMKLLFQRGVVVVATSNWPLEGLFQGGLNRGRFMPFLQLMERHLTPVDLSNGPDWRQQKPAGAGAALSHYLVSPSGQAAEAQLQALFETYGTGRAPAELAEWPLGKSLRRQQGRAAWLTFAQACDIPRSRHDYAQLVNHYDTFVLEGVPLLTPNDADATIRLVTLIDILYENRRRLIMSAAALPADLCRLPTAAAGGVTTWPAAQLFMRTASRLVEMTRSNDSAALQQRR